MSLPLDIGTRRASIAKLTLPSPRGLFGSNARFLRTMSPHEDVPSAISSSPDTDSADFSAGLHNPKLIELVSRHLKSHDKTLDSEGADITRELYLLGDAPRPTLMRSRSWSLCDSAARRGSLASALNVPGGFRRHYVLAHKRAPNLLTKNFVEFLSIYGHFAGESLEDDVDVACHFLPVPPKDADESTALVKSANPSGTASDTKAYFLLLKAFVGTGVLFLPRAFASGGLAFSIVTLLIFGLLSFWCYLILVRAKTASGVSTFADMGLHCYGAWLQRLILLSIVLSQVGFVAAYIVFTAENLRAFVANVSGVQGDIFWFILLQAAVLAPLSLIRDITRLSLLALLANGFIFVGLLTILYYTFRELAGNNFVPGEGVYYLFNSSEFSLFIGVAIFAFEGIGLIIPIHDSMIYPQNFPKVLFKVIATISLIFIFIGALGYLTFGDSIDTVILLNLPQKAPPVIMIQLLYAMAILLSTPIQIFPAVRLIELKIFVPLNSGRHSLAVKWQKNLLRFVFVFLTATIALYGGQNLDKFVSFVGCFACIPLVYMYPPMLHLKTCCDYTNDSSHKRSTFWLAMLDYALLVVGSAVLVYTTYDILAH